MIKSELIAKIAAENSHLTHADAEKVVRTVFDAITAQLAVGGRVELRGFGSFVARKREARQGRNPKTGEPVQVDEKAVPMFRLGKSLKDSLNAQ